MEWICPDVINRWNDNKKARLGTGFFIDVSEELFYVRRDQRAAFFGITDDNRVAVVCRKLQHDFLTGLEGDRFARFCIDNSEGLSLIVDGADRAGMDVRPHTVASKRYAWAKQKRGS